MTIPRVQLSTALQEVRPAARTLRARWERLGRGQSQSRRSRDAASYWTDPASPNWHSNSHWRSGLGGVWESVGTESLAISQRLARVTGADLPARRTVEWGCGGGANAVQFAPRCGEFVAVDVVPATLEECESQVRAVCTTPVHTVLVDVEAPEAAVADIGPGSCDLFICFYVFELLPSREYGERLLEVARDLLAPGGVAVVQVKYATAEPATHSRRRAYRRNPSDMTTYPIDEFWCAAQRHGLVPQAVHLVPANALDERYAYYLLTRP